MGNQSTMLHVRIDPTTKEKAQQAFSSMGLSMADAVRLFLTRVIADQAIPFELKVPNAITEAAMREADEMIANGSARFATPEELFKSLDQKD